MATYVGTNGNNVNQGNQQTQYGLDGDDFLSPTNNNKSYFLYGGNGDDTLSGYGYDDELFGGRGRDTMFGLGGNDIIDGGSGNDMIYGHYGNDLLSGGRGRDVFVFDTKLNTSKNVDTITDYDTTKDLIDLDKDIFTTIGPVGQTLLSKKFVIAKEAQDLNDRIIYHAKSGVLKYDPDGTGSQSAKKFAVLDSNLDLTHFDFFVI